MNLQILGFEEELKWTICCKERLNEDRVRNMQITLNCQRKKTMDDMQ